ncbi:MAG: tRNA (adenosine(37)-N6)-threonylcarbamoyltransferase complex transferase subunit TsaD [Patescibacteria group bacterium]
MIILGIETSCDETAASIVEGEGDSVRVLSDIVSSQIEIHKKYGGVVPEVAAREHVLNILPVINEALEKARIGRDKAGKEIDAIAVTIGPGLVTSLMVGVETAKTLAFAWDVPLIALNHIEGHIYANFIKQEKIDFPALILTVSGGHNLLVLMKGHGKFKIVGETLDDAAGEAFDKAAKMMGIGYPGGPAIAAEAVKFSIFPPRVGERQRVEAGNFQFSMKDKITLPRPMIHSKNYDFSFSGLKTAFLYEMKKDPDWKNRIPEYAHEFQQAVVDVLVHKTWKAARDFKVKTVMLSGCVSANKELRKKMEEEVKRAGLEFGVPDLRYTTDNAAMIASAGYFRAREKKFTPIEKVQVDPNLELK